MMRWHQNVGKVTVVAFFAALIFKTSVLEQNLARMRSLHALLACADTPILIEHPYTIWVLNLKYSTACVQPPSILADPAMVAFAAWLSGKQIESEQLSQIRPSTRQEIFAWRNRSQSYLPISYAVADSLTVARFVSTLAVDAWHSNQKAQSVQLAKAAMGEKTAKEIVDVLLNGIMPQKSDDYLVFEQVRKTIAQAIPTNVANYATWFEIALNYQQWKSAEHVCRNFRKYATAVMTSLAAVCSARLAFHQGDYALAYAESKQSAKTMPNDPLVLTWLGINAKQLEKYKEAASAFQRALQHETEPDALLNLYWQLGNCQQALGQQAQAQQSYRSALQYDRTGYYQHDLLQLLERTR